MKSKPLFLATGVLIIFICVWYGGKSFLDDQDAMVITPEYGEPSNLTANDQKAISIAREALELGNRAATFKVKGDDEGVIAVYVERLPPVVGGHAIVLMDKDGQVQRILRGK